MCLMDPTWVRTSFLGTLSWPLDGVFGTTGRVAGSPIPVARRQGSVRYRSGSLLAQGP